ncbi:hypothetical protein [Marinibacterium profundimaris]|uniref:Transmembrane protein n=1 Tax=Marinibacterium profundimaris TaxID=1679460 RepID=A0A225NA22_9RHOB|nr:hypothetical protein [Marinibacterium profundimaris]OWU66526.1 hypothetical protein ATO3_27835 [Marinibacterium profundimaris]
MTAEHQPRRDEDQAEFSEEQASLLKITLGPLIWAGHFVICYGLVAVTCAKDWDIATIRAGLLGFSGAALLAIAWVGWTSWRQWNPRETGDFVNRRGRSEDRHHFLGHAAFLLSIIAVIGVIFVSLPLVMLDSCR